MTALDGGTKTGEDAPQGGSPRAARSLPRWRPTGAALFALAAGLAVTAILSLTSLAVYNRNERRLLNLRVREVGLVLTATAPSVQTPLASAAELASATNGSPQKFRAFMKPYVGPGRQFGSASLWPLGGSRLAPTAVVGTPPLLASLPERARQFFATSAQPGVLNLSGILGSKHPTLGFEFSQPGPRRTFAVYAENPLPADRRSKLESNSAFSDLDYVLYLGNSQRPGDLLLTSVKRLPVKGRHAATLVHFGAGTFTIVVAPRGSLGGSFFESLPWIVAIVGVIVALAAALLTDRLARGRKRAEELAATLDRVAGENRRMYTEQRSISQTLQHALLPDELPTMEGVQVDARYVPAGAGVEVGGDWYDIVSAGERRVLLVIGDVSGHGLRAATTMALVRHATLAYATQDARPGAVLGRLAQFVNRDPHDYFATVLCVLIDLDARSLTAASAGHMPPLLLDDGAGDYVSLHVGVPIGVQPRGDYREQTLPLPADATLIAFTDGLVERRGEVLDVGLGRLRDLATAEHFTLDDLLAKLAEGLAEEDRDDDTAIVGISWQT